MTADDPLLAKTITDIEAVTASKAVPDVVAASSDVVVVKTGRRKSDVQAFATRGRHVLLWVFGVFLDEKSKPSMGRIMLALWTVLGWQMEYHEIRLTPTQPALSNAAFAAWWAAEGFLALAVFGPRIASYFGPGAAGAVTGINASIRDGLQKIEDHVNAEG